MLATSPDKTLTSSKRSKSFDLTGLLMDAAQEAGVSPFRITLDIVRRSIGRHRIGPQDYFQFRMFRPDLSAAERDAFVSEAEISRLNRSLAPDEIYSVAGVINSKLLTELVLRGAGLPTSRTVAVARAQPARLPFPVLTGADAIEDFLRTEGNLPIFGKPDESSFGIGAASLVRLEGAELVLGDGTRTPLRKLAEEIARDYPHGYVFQKLLEPHPEMARLIGPVVGSLRVLSLWLRGGPEPLYLMQKMPGPGAMVDGGMSGANAAAFVDPVSGQIVRAQLLSTPLGQDLTHNHITGAPSPGARLPDFDAAVALALDAHRLFPRQGVLGSDVILTKDGPVINEVNLNPLCGLVQNARGSGLFDETFKAKYREALAVQGVRLPVKGVGL